MLLDKEHKWASVSSLVAPEGLAVLVVVVVFFSCLGHNVHSLVNNSVTVDLAILFF